MKPRISIIVVVSWFLFNVSAFGNGEIFRIIADSTLSDSARAHKLQELLGRDIGPLAERAPNGDTPLHAAVRADLVPVVLILLTNRANLYALNQLTGQAAVDLVPGLSERLARMYQAVAPSVPTVVNPSRNVRRALFIDVHGQSAPLNMERFMESERMGSDIFFRTVAVFCAEQIASGEAFRQRHGNALYWAQGLSRMGQAITTLLTENPNLRSPALSALDQGL
jgi:hypothetical protein